LPSDIAFRIPTGNKELLELGAIEWQEVISRDNLSQQLSDSAKSIKGNKQENLNFFDLQEQNISQAEKPKTDDKQEAVSTEIIEDKVFLFFLHLLPFLSSRLTVF
jgi:hypothetical protein